MPPLDRVIRSFANKPGIVAVVVVTPFTKLDGFAGERSLSRLHQFAGAE